MKFSEFNIASNAGQIDYIVGYSGIQNYRISPSQFIGTYSTLNYIADSGNGTIDLGTQAFSILGTANEIETVGVAQTLTLRFPAAGVILPDGSRATTQPLGDNSTKVATTAYVNASITAEDLDFSGDTGTGSVDLDSQILNIIGTTNEIETAASGQTLTIGLPDDVSITGELTVLGIGQSSFAGQVTIPLNPVANTDAASKGYVDSQITAQDLDFTGDSGTGQVDLDSQALSITGGAVITTTALNQNLNIVHDNVSRTDTTSTDSPAFGGTFTSVDSVSSSSQGHITAINVKTVTLPTPSDATITLDAGTLLNGGGDFTLNQALNETITFNHDSVSRTDTTSTDAPAFGGTFTAVDSVTSSTEGHITGINLKTVTVPTPTYPTVNNNTITISAGSNLNGGGDFTLNQNVDETITVNLDTTITGLTSVTSTTFAGQLNGSISSATTATTQAPNDNSTKVATTAYVDSSAGNYLPLAGGTMSGSIAMGGNNISGGGTATFTTFVGALQGNADTASALAASGNITLTGDTTSTGGPYTYTSGGNVAIATTIADTTVTGKVLTGVNLGTAQVIAATDSILDAFGYLQAQITQLPQGLVYQGTWNASTNTPTLSSGTGTTGHFYIVSVAGSTNLDGITDWQVGDWAIFVEAGGTDTWQKIDNTSAITGTGTANKLAKWTGPTTLSTGLVEDDGTTVTIGNSGDLDVTGSADITGDLAWSTSLTDTTNLISITKFVDEADGITANDNDTSIPTSAAVKDYVDTQIGTVDTLADVLSNGNTTGGTDISVSSGDDITFAANSKTIFNSALSIYNTGTQSVIYANTNNLLIDSTTYATVQALSDIYLKPNGGNNGITITGGGAVTLYHNNAQKLATTSTGLTVTGRISNLTDPTLAQDAATKNYVDTQLGGQDTLAEILANGNTTGGTDISVSAGDDITFADSSKSIYGAGSDLQIYHDGSNSLILNDTGKLIIRNRADDQDIQFDCDNGSGGVETYFYLDGSAVNTRFTKDIKLNDSTKAIFGGGGDLEIYHDGSNSYIKDAGTGSLIIEGDTSTQIKGGTYVILRSLTNENMLVGNANGSVDIYYDNSKKLETTSTGITVTGGISTSNSITLSNPTDKYIRFIDTYGNWDIEVGDGANNFKIHSGSLNADYLTLEGGGQLNLGEYGSGSFTGTATYRLAVDSSGDVIEIPIGDGAVDGSGTANTVTMWSDTDTITDAPITISGNNATFAGNVTTGGQVTVPSGYSVNIGTSRIHSTDTSYLLGGNVGIGTSSPQRKLHLHESSSSGSFIAFTNDTTGQTSTDGAIVGIDGGEDMLISTYEDKNIEFRTGNTERMRITSGGSVGIGTTTPNYLLDVEKSGANVRIYDTTGNTTLNLTSSNTANNNIEFGDTEDANVGQIIYRHASNSMSFTTNASEAMRIDSSGRVGIGTTSPQAKLDIVNSGLSTQLRLSNTTSDATTKYGVITGRHYTNSEENVTGMLITSSSSVIGGSVSIGGGVSAANAVNEIKFYTAANNTTLTGTERMRIDSSGNVGIGQTSLPTNTRLNITGTNNYTLSSSSGMGGIKISGTTAGQGNYTSGIGFAFGSGTAGISGVQGTADSDTMGLAFFTHPSGTGSAAAEEKMRIDYLGNVGIGDNNPTTKLSVGGTVKVTGSGTGLLLYGTGGGGNIDAFGSNTLVLMTNSTERMRIDSSGRVGIGTTSPNHKLDIYSNENVPLRIHRPSNANLDSSGAWGIGFSTRGDAVTSTTDTRAGIFSYYNGNLFFATNTSSIVADPDASARMTITSAGYVGIGLTSPSAKLEIQDSTHTTMKIRSGNNDNILFAQAIQSQDSRIGTETNTDLSLYTNGSERMRIDSSGNVGINETSPSSYFSSDLVVKVKASLGGITIRSNATTDTNYLMFADGTTGNERYRGYISYDHNADIMKLATGASRAITIDNIQRVGIGTDSPSRELDVEKSSDNAIISAVSHPSYIAGLVLGDTSDDDRGGILYNNNGDYLYFLSNAVERMRITDTLITFPTVTELRGDISSNKFAIGNMGDYASQMMISSRGFLTFNVSNTGSALNATERMRIDSSGNVGIGYTSPSSFDQRVNAPHLVVGSGSNSAGVTIFSGTASQGSINFADGTTTTDQYTGGIVYVHGSDNYMSFHTNGGTERMRIASDGQVTVTGTSTTMKLYNGASSTGVLHFGNADFLLGYDSGVFKQRIWDGADYFNAIEYNGASHRLILAPSEGSVGIGTSSPSNKLDVNGDGRFVSNSSSRVLYLKQNANDAGNIIQFENQNGTNVWELVGRNNQFYIYNNSLNSHSLYINPSTNNIGIGVTSPTYKFHVASSNNVSIFEDTSGSSGAAFCLFNAPSNFAMGSITRNGTANSVLFNTGSDYRLKEDLQDFNALDLVDNITAYDYKWKDTDQRDYGFVAHELQEVMPNVVSGEKDGERMQSVDYSKLTPVLLKAIQEQQEIINDLKSRIQILENN